MTSQLEGIIQDAIERGHVLGLSIAFLRGEEIGYAQGFGLASHVKGRPVTAGTLFGVGSISKVILAALVMRLVEAGLLDLDQPVVEYLPGFAFSDPKLGKRITLRHILSHTSGLPAAGKDFGPRHPDALRLYIWEQLARHSFIAEPGRIHLYSNTAITLAGHIAEVVTGKYYSDLVQEQVFVPLQMKSATFDPQVALTHPFALPHEMDGSGQPVAIERLADNVSGNPSGFCYSSALDLARLALAHLNRGRANSQPFLHPKSIDQMHAPQAGRPIDGAAYPLSHTYSGYGLGFMTGRYKGHRVVRHGGLSQSYNCFFELLPDERLGFILLTNYSREPYLSDLVVQIYDELLEIPARARGNRVAAPRRALSESEKARWPSFEGAYLNVEHGQLAKIQVVNDQLLLEQESQARPLIPIGKGQYYARLPDGLRLPVSFLESPDGQVDDLFVFGSPYRRVQLDPGFAPDPSAWAAFPGCYRDPTNLEPDAGLEIRLAGEALHLSGEGADEDLIPLDHARFLSSLGLVEFESEVGGGLPTLVLGKATRYFRS